MARRFDLKVLVSCLPALVSSWQGPLGQNILQLSVNRQVCIAYVKVCNHLYSIKLMTCDKVDMRLYPHDYPCNTASSPILCHNWQCDVSLYDIFTVTDVCHVRHSSQFDIVLQKWAAEFEEQSHTTSEPPAAKPLRTRLLRWFKGVIEYWILWGLCSQQRPMCKLHENAKWDNSIKTI